MILPLIGQTRKTAIFTATTAEPYRWLMQALSAMILVVILATAALFWSAPDPGYEIDLSTATVTFVAPGGIAEQGGLQVDDRILDLTDRPWDVVLTQLNSLPLTSPQDHPVQLRIDRAGVIRTVTFAPVPPDAAFQALKVTRVVLALLCLLTGYSLGIVRRHEAPGSLLVAGFWLGMSSVLGLHLFAVYASSYLTMIVQWLIIVVLVPLSIYIHVWFPARPVPARQAQAARRALLGIWCLLNVGFAASIMIWQPSLSQLISILSPLPSFALLVGFVGSGVVLHRAYRHTTTSYVRRQIRLIAMACFFLAAFWLVTLIIPTLLGQPVLIPDFWIDLATVIVPLAYLVGGVVRDLYRLDRIVMRLGVHVATTSLVVGLLVALAITFALQGTTAILWLAVCFVVLYRPMQQLGFRLVPAHMNPAYSTYHALHTAAANLVSTLERQVLIETVTAGVRATFGAPAMAFYAGDIEGSNELTCVIQERLPQLPETILAGGLTEWLCLLPSVTESRALHAALAKLPISRDEGQAFHHPGVVLWCPITHTDGYLLGVLLLGMRGDLDPYRAEDIRELRRLLAAASLALANSAAYAQRREAEVMIRQLYQRLQQTQDATAAAIARELHDEIMNVNVRLNIESLQKVIGRVGDPILQAELALVLESECAMGQALRMICEQLHPTGIDDPLGLSAVLRMHVEKVQAIWPGTCRLVVEHGPCPVTAQAQREALRITREALTNAIKHASATEIVVHLRYPDTPIGMLQLVIRDNGRSGQVIQAKNGHFGIRNMEESARAVGGTLQFCREADGGTAVVFRFAPGKDDECASLYAHQS